MISEKNIICIACPRGCRLIVSGNTENSKNENIAVNGNNCPKGVDYGRQEFVCPMRMLTSTVAIKNANGNSIYSRLPVKTDKEVPLDNIHAYMNVIRTVVANPPICVGDIVIKNILDSDVNLVATGTCI